LTKPLPIISEYPGYLIVTAPCHNCGHSYDQHSNSGCNCQGVNCSCIGYTPWTTQPTGPKSIGDVLHAALAREASLAGFGADAWLAPEELYSDLPARHQAMFVRAANAVLVHVIEALRGVQR